MSIVTKRILILVTLYWIIISTLYAVMSIVQHSHYATFADLGIFNQGIWQYSRFQWPFETFQLNRYFLGDHFHPILMVLAPFYWFYASEKTLLVLQPFIMLSAIIPLALIAFHQTKSYIFSFSIILAYSFFLPLQYTIFYDFHEIIFFPPLYAWSYYFFMMKKKLLTAVFLVLILLTKEELGFLVATFGLYLLVFQKGWRIFGVIWVLVGIAYSLTMMYLIIPKIGGSYLYFNYGSSGNTPLDVLTNLLKRPTDFVNLFFTPEVKVETLYKTFWPFAYLPLFSPIGLLLSIEQFFTRFIDQRNVVRWTIGYHYSAPMTVILALGTIWTVNFYTKFLPKYRKHLIILVSILLIVLTRIEQINNSAVLLFKRAEFWQRAPWMDNIDQAVAKVPKDVSVAAQNNIISHLSNRKNIYSLDNLGKAQYIVVDFHPGQSGYDFFGDDQKLLIQKEIETGIKEGKYQIIYHQDDVYLLKNPKL